MSFGATFSPALVGHACIPLPSSQVRRNPSKGVATLFLCFIVGGRVGRVLTRFNTLLVFPL